LAEAADLQIYSRLVTAFAEYVDTAPGSGMGRWLDQLTEIGIKAVPSDKRAQAVLDHVLRSRSSAFAVQQFGNASFADLPIGVRPQYLDDKKRIVTASWKHGDRVYARVQQLIAWDGKPGNWCDAQGNNIKLVDVPVKEAAENDHGDDAAEKREVQIGKEILKLVANIDDEIQKPQEKIEELAKELITMHEK
jgi:hypothetical protein